MKQLDKNTQGKVLLITLGNAHRLQRVKRNIACLVEMGFRIDVLSQADCSLKGVESSMLLDEPYSKISHRIYRLIARILRVVVPGIQLKYFLTRYLQAFPRQVEKISRNYDHILIEHIDFLIPVSNGKKIGAKVIFDIKDYYPREFEGSLNFMVFEGFYRKLVFKSFLPGVDAKITVSNGLRNLLKNEYFTDSVVLYNAPQYQNLSAGRVEHGIFRCVHHGAFIGERGFDELVKCRGFNETRTLDLFLVGDTSKFSSYNGNDRHPSIQLKDPVAPSQIIKTLHGYDIGIIFYPQTKNINLTHCLPNKFFEYVQARLMIITTPLADIAELVEKHNLGIVLPSFSIEALEACLKSLTLEQVMLHKQAAHEASRELCFENEANKLKSIMQSL